MVINFGDIIFIILFWYGIIAGGDLIYYLISFLEGVITFVSPCLLPMLPVYISFFAGGRNDEEGNRSAIINALGFVLGFTAIFVLLGAFAGSIGRFLRKYDDIINIAAGIIIVLFGLNFTGLIRVPLINNTVQIKMKNRNTGFLSSLLFGIIFSIGWTPCAGAFLGSALMMAVTEGERLKGIIMLLCYSIGLGAPYIISALLIDRIKKTFEFIIRNYRIINLVSGGLLIIVGILIATGYMGYLLSLLTF